MYYIYLRNTNYTHANVVCHLFSTNFAYVHFLLFISSRGICVYEYV